MHGPLRRSWLVTLEPAATRASSATPSHLGDHPGMDDADQPDLEQLLASYYRMCAEAGVEPLLPDEARGSAKAMMALLVPAFETEFRRH